MTFVDSHCHLDKIDENNPDAIANYVANAQSRNVEHMLCVAVNVAEFDRMYEQVSGFNNVSVSCGVHPCYDEDVVPIETLRAYANREQVVAIGETGLDYYHTQDTIAVQKQSFIDHIHVALEVDKPLIVHTRNARTDTIAMLKEHGKGKVRGVLHCFTEDLAMAEAAIELGFYISFSGIVTFKSAKELQQVAKTIPLERMLIETDSPWLAPVPYRGKTNQPAYVVEVAECIAELRGVSVAHIAEQTTANFYRLFDSVNVR
ncbi:MAG: YchF/TatD family DNA exonuclease [Alteromonadaceae bacterium]|nr:YchF/TatD family DNA exonuclease [Alteromonadaceae bacterium]